MNNNNHVKFANTWSSYKLRVSKYRNHTELGISLAMEKATVCLFFLCFKSIKKNYHTVNEFIIIIYKKNEETKQY